MSEQQQGQHTSQQDEQAILSIPGRQVTQREVSDGGFDALLDEIDGLLEGNAAEYVRSFVQKGGQ